MTLERERYTPISMYAKVSDVLDEALSLSERNRATLAGVLIERLEGQPDPNAEAAWPDEIRRSVAEVEAGRVESVPCSKVRQRPLRGFE